jgi:hypothetical protein
MDQCPGARSLRPRKSNILRNGWVIRDGGRVHASDPDEQIRISILWKARVRPSGAAGGGDPLTPDRIVEISARNLESHGLRIATQASPLYDETWLDLVHLAYFVPVNVPE